MRGSRAPRTRQRLFSTLLREALDVARRPKGVPTRPPRSSASSAPDPPVAKTQPVFRRSIFLRAFFGNPCETRVGETSQGASSGSGTSGKGAHIVTYLAEGLGHVVHGPVGVHDGVLQQTSRGVQRKGRFVVRLGGVVRALRGERPERDPLRFERAVSCDRARGGAAKGEHRANAWGVLLSARV